MNREHSLKTDPEVFEAVRTRAKTHEIRLNDRNYSVGDVLLLRETKFTGAQMHMRPEACPLIYTGRTLRRTVTHVLTGYGLNDRWAILSLDEHEREDIHSCIDDVNAELAKRHTMLAPVLAAGDGEYIQLATTKAGSKHGARVVAMFCTYCPFCGVKLKRPT